MECLHLSGPVDGIGQLFVFDSYVNVFRPMYNIYFFPLSPGKKRREYVDENILNLFFLFFSFFLVGQYLCI